MGAVVLAFAVFGVLWGAWVVTLADLARDLALGPAALGACGSLGIVGSLFAMSRAGRLVARRGSVRIGAVGAVGVALGLLACALLAHTYALLVAGVLLLYTSGALYDVAVNAATAALERTSGKKLMPFAHAGFSGGGALGAFGAGAALSAGVPFRDVWLALAALLALEAGAMVALGLPAPAPADTEPAAAADAGAKARLSGAGPIALLFGGGLGLLGAVAAAAFFSEGAMENWATYYLRESIGAPALLGSTGAGLFHTTMFLGRLASGLLVRRAGNHRALFWAGALVAVGTLLAVATRDLGVVVAGFALIGVALSGAFPLTLSLAGEAARERTAEAVAAVTLVGYTGFLVGPTLFGALAQGTSLRAAFATLLAAGAFMSLTAGVLARRRASADGR